MNDRICGKAVLVLILTGLVGCSRNETASTSTEPIATEPQGRVESPSVEVTIVDRTEYDAALVSLKGKVVLVDCWASWCLPCLQQLPHSLELAELHDDLAVVTLNFDDPSKIEQVAKMLASKGGTTHQTHLLSREGGGTQSMVDFEITSGALPHYKLYDQTGKLRQTLELDPSAETQFTTADIDAAVTKLLRESLP